jgi:hypothetical protein
MDNDKGCHAQCALARIGGLSRHYGTDYAFNQAVADVGLCLE